MRLRAPVDPAFGRVKVQGLQARVEAIADGLFEELLGLPLADRPAFLGRVDALVRITSAAGIFRALPALRQVSAALRAEPRRRRELPGEDVLGALAAGSSACGGLSEEEQLAMCFALFVAGYETATHLVAGGVHVLLQHPAEMERLRAEPELMPRAVDELLRFVSPVLLTRPRFALTDLRIGAAPVRRGESVCALIGAANSDPAEFVEPERLDLGRTRNRHLGFGSGPHTFLGLQLARLEMRVVLSGLFRRWPRAQLALPVGRLRWQGRTAVRALEALPLRLC